MENVVIVAIPAEDDKVYRISSEEIPHLTICFLGDQSNSDQLVDIVEFVQHAASQLDPFGLTVDHRGTLGADDADVVFFEKDTWAFPRVSAFRSNLLKNDSIARAYESVDQYPEWTPHLTLGYPETPANEDTSEYPGIHHVRFDRIAVWMGNFEGPTFRLKREDYAMEVSMSDMSTTERGEQAAYELFHHGVKGMKWGVRKSERTQARATALAERSERRSGKLGSAAEARKGAKLQKVADQQRRREAALLDSGRGKIKRGATKANTALDAGAKVIRDGEKKLIFLPQKNRDKAAAATQTQVLAAAVTINRSPQFKGKDLKTNPALKAAYFKKVEAAAKKIYADELGIARTEAWAEFLGTKIDGTGMRITAASNRIQHAESSGEETLLELTWELDDLGQIIDVGVPESYLGHSTTERGEDAVKELFHHGVKGMRWGVRNNPDGTVSVDQTRVRKSLLNAKDVTVSQRKAGTFVKAKGGQRQKAADDAVKAQAGRQKAKKSTTDALSNKELKDTIERMRLEQEYAKLDKRVSRRGSGFVSRLLQSPAARMTAEDLLKRAAEANA